MTDKKKNRKTMSILTASFRSFRECRAERAAKMDNFDNVLKKWKIHDLKKAINKQHLYFWICIGMILTGMYFILTAPGPLHFSLESNAFMFGFMGAVVMRWRINVLQDQRYRSFFQWIRKEV